MKKVDIVVPVYKGYDETVACIETVISSINPSLTNFIVINDCGPEPELTNYLRSAAAKYNFTLLENKTNLGFTGTANRGMTYHQDTDVILLNSDVEVVNDWVERLQSVAYLDPKIATVTPFSNNATICSFPNFCQDNDLYPGVRVESIDNVFASLSLDKQYVEVPTGVGFCMYMKREAINSIGLLDVETFGKGYGEENDWCQRAIKGGWLNVHALNVFVYHKGGVSFADEQNPRKTKATELLHGLHPNYPIDVMKFVAMDPAQYAREQAEIALIAKSSMPKVLIVSHRLGGGVEHHIDQLIQLYDGKIKFILCQPDETKGCIKLTLFADRYHRNTKGMIFSLNENKEDFINLLTSLNISNIHYHHLAGFQFELLDSLSSLELSYEITIHDYYLINGNPTLCDKNGRFIADEINERDRYCAEQYPVPFNLSVTEWRTYISEWLSGAKRVIFPSYDTFARFMKYYPLIKNISVVAWHPDQLANEDVQPNLSYDGKDKLKVLVLGALSREKGADKLESVAKQLKNTNIEFHLLGYAYRPLDSAVICHGPYLQEDVFEKIAEIEPHVVWFPAQCAETYSFTLSQVLHAGLPVIAPNIGAFPERLDKRSCTKIVDWQSSTENMVEIFQELMHQPHNFFAETYNYQPNDNVDFNFIRNFYYVNYAQNKDAKNITECDYLFIADAVNKYMQSTNLYGSGSAPSFKERVLVFLWRVSQHQVVSPLLKYIPYSMQRTIKRLLSRQPMHNILK